MRKDVKGGQSLLTLNVCINQIDYALVFLGIIAAGKLNVYII